MVVLLFCFLSSLDFHVFRISYNGMYYFCYLKIFQCHSLQPMYLPKTNKQTNNVWHWTRIQTVDRKNITYDSCFERSQFCEKN